MAEQQAGQDEGAKDSAKAGLGDPERTARLCAAMKAAGLDAVVCTSPSEVLLLTGYWPIFATSVAVLTAEGALRAIVPEDEQELAAGSSGAQLTTYEPEMLTKLTGPVAQLREPLGAVLTQLGLERATIGVRLQLGVQPVSYGVMTEFRQSLGDLLGKLAPEARLESCDDLLGGAKGGEDAARAGADAAGIEGGGGWLWSGGKGDPDGTAGGGGGRGGAGGVRCGARGGGARAELWIFLLHVGAELGDGGGGLRAHAAAAD